VTTVIPFAGNKGQGNTNVAADDSGRSIIAMVQKAAAQAKEDCGRAMDLAHRLSSQLQAAEVRTRELEAEVNHFRERAARAENWLTYIHSEVEQTFFSENERDQGQRRKST
jgi:hypothetical protein